MKQRLQRIFSILCILALVTGCLFPGAFAEEDTVSRVIRIEWDDEDNYEGLRPAAVSAKINGQDITVKAEDQWTASATVPADFDGAWSVTAPAGYEDAVLSGGSIATASFRHTVPRIGSLSVSAAWSDTWKGEANGAGLRPESVRVNLLADGEICRTATLTEAGGWTAAFTDLYMNAYKDGTLKAIAYTAAAADDPADYTASASGTTVTYTLKTATLSVKAVLSGVPADADVSGLSLTVTGPRFSETRTYGSFANGTWDIGTVLPGSYVLQENNAGTLIDGYTMDPAGSKVGDAVYLEAGDTGVLNFKYTWKEPGEEEENANPQAAVGDLEFKIIGPDPSLPKTIYYRDFTNGKYELNNLIPGEYAVIETNAEGLVQAYTLKSDSTTGIVVTVGADGKAGVLLNKYEPALTPSPNDETVEIPVTKIWNDDNNKDGNRPASVTVRLYADGIRTDEHEITAEEGWKYSFTELPRYNADGSEIAYSVDEAAVTWYSSVVNGYTITNTYQPETTTASVLKIWNDDGNTAVRPTSIAVTLQPANTVYVLDSSNGWKAEVTGLPTRINGEPVSYYWTEQQVVGYRSDNGVVTGSLTTFTNSYIDTPTIDENNPQAKTGGSTWLIIEPYDTALGGDVIINHVGDCFD